MNILVIGNGFDIAHGLPTGYKDFLLFISIFQSLVSNLVFTPSCVKEEKMLGFLKSLNERRINDDESAVAVWNELNELIDNNVWISYFQIIGTKECWVDFEKEISRVIQALDSARKHVEEKTRHGEKSASIESWQYGILRPIFGFEPDDYRNISFEPKAFTYRKQQLLKDLNRLTRGLEIYLCEYINSFPVSQALPVIQALNVDKVLSFNYTNTFERVYNAEGQKKIDFDFIHGKAYLENDVDSCNMVIGIDEYLRGEDKDQDNEYIEFKKFYQRIFKGTGNSYTRWLISSNSYVLDAFQKNRSKVHPQVNVYFYGHSLDVTDKDILRQLLTSEWVVATIFYHSKEALGSQISNLVKVIGEEELIARTGGPEQRIIFKQISQRNSQ